MYGKMKQVRDLQIEDDKVQQRMRDEEDKRLDAVMDYDNDMCGHLQRQLDDAKRAERGVYGKALREQIDERCRQRTLDREREQREAKETIDRWKYVNMRDVDALRLKAERQRQVREDILRDITDSRRIKADVQEIERAQERAVSSRLYYIKYDLFIYQYLV